MFYEIILLKSRHTEYGEQRNVSKGRYTMIQDLHSHTYYSACGRDDPHFTVQAAIDGGIEMFGITDHNYGIADRKPQYYKEMCALKDEYAGQIKLFCGIEIATVSGLCITEDEDVSYFDYCLIEHIDRDDSCVGRDIVNFAKRCGCKAGIAHTDLIGYAKRRGENPVEFLKELAGNDIFWEMNMSFDSIHGYREHGYMLEFFSSPEQQEIVRESGIMLSVGFDGHRVEDYRPDRVAEACRKIGGMNIPMFKG